MTTFRSIAMLCSHGLLIACAGGQPCGNAWFQWSGQGPGGRDRYSLSYDSARLRVVMFGGSPIPGSGLLTDTWEWDGSGAGTWSQRATTGPPGRTEPALAYDSVRARTVLFGGRIGATTVNDTWEWDGTAWTQRFPATSPAGRYLAPMDFDAARSVVVLAAGIGATSLTDTWEWNGTDWTQRSATQPVGYGSMTYDPVRQRIAMLVYGPPWILQEWDGSAWTTRATTNSPQSGPMPLRFDPRLSSLTVPGYSLQGYGGWTWVLQPGGAWEIVSSQHPMFDFNVVVTFDGFHMLEMGRLASTMQIWLGDSLVRSGPTVTQPVTPSGDPHPGQPFSLTAAATGNGTLEYRWRRNGVNLNNGPGITGADTPQLTLTNPGLASNGAYSVAVTDSCGTIIPPAYQLDVPCYANCDRNDALNANDFHCYLNRFAAGCDSPQGCYVNCDGSTAAPFMNANDFQCFLNAFAKGCS